MACSGGYADVQDFQEYFCKNVPNEQEATVNGILRRAAGRIHAARHASAQCDCTLASWASEYLIELNLLIAVTVYACPCSGLRLTDEQKEAIMLGINADLAAIRTGELELCAGETGADFPVTMAAPQSVSEFASVQIIANDILRNSG